MFGKIFDKFNFKIVCSLIVVIFTFSTFSTCNAAVNYSKLLGKVTRRVAKRAVKNYLKTSILDTGNPELSIGGAEIGESMNEIENILGDANNFQRLENPGTLFKVYRNGAVGVISKDNIATAIFCEDYNLSTRRGIHVGSSAQDIVNAYGEDYFLENLDNYYDVILYQVEFNDTLWNKAKNFFSSDDKVGQIFFVVNRLSYRVVCAGVNVIE